MTAYHVPCALLHVAVQLHPQGSSYKKFGRADTVTVHTSQQAELMLASEVACQAALGLEARLTESYFFASLGVQMATLPEDHVLAACL